MDIFSSPFNPQMFAHIANTGIMGSTTLTSSDMSSSNPSSTRPPSSFPPLDAHDSRQAHSNNASFASPSHPYLKPNFPDHASQALPQYGIKPRTQSPGMAHISPPVPRINGRSRNGLPDGRHIAHHGDGSTHSRQDSAGQIICKQKPHSCLLTLWPARVRRFVNILTALLLFCLQS